MTLTAVHLIGSFIRPPRPRCVFSVSTCQPTLQEHKAENMHVTINLSRTTTWWSRLTPGHLAKDDEVILFANGVDIAAADYRGSLLLLRARSIYGNPARNFALLARLRDTSLVARQN